MSDEKKSLSEEMHEYGNEYWESVEGLEEKLAEAKKLLQEKAVFAHKEGEPVHVWTDNHGKRKCVPDSWEGFTYLLDQRYPESVIPTLADDPKRDPGPRIVSLARHLVRAEEKLASAQVLIEIACKFHDHIADHLGPGQVVICKICGKTAEEIMGEEVEKRVPASMMCTLGGGCAYVDGVAKDSKALREKVRTMADDLDTLIGKDPENPEYRISPKAVQDELRKLIEGQPSEEGSDADQ